MSSNPRWWRITFWIAVGVLSLAVVVFLWALTWPARTDDLEWTQLGAAIVSALTGFLMIAILGALGIFHLIRDSRRRSSSVPRS